MNFIHVVSDTYIIPRHFSWFLLTKWFLFKLWVNLVISMTNYYFTETLSGSNFQSSYSCKEGPTLWPLKWISLKAIFAKNLRFAVIIPKVKLEFLLIDCWNSWGLKYFDINTAIRNKFRIKLVKKKSLFFFKNKNNSYKNK